MSHDKNKEFTDVELTLRKKIVSCLFRENYAAFCYYAERIIKKESEAEDLVLEIFSHLLLNSTRLSDISDLKAYMYKAIYFRCINHLKSKKRFYEWPDEIIINIPEEDRIEYKELEVIRTEVLNTVYKEIENLPNKCREVFKLMYQQHMSVEQIARQLDISQRTVYTQKFRAIKHLRLVLLKKNLLIVTGIIFVNFIPTLCYKIAAHFYTS